MNNSKGTAALFLIATLLIGGALGYSVARVLHPDSESYVAGSADYWNQIAKDWGLNSQQKAVIDSLLDVQQSKISDLYGPLTGQFDSVAEVARAIGDTTLTAMSVVLNEKQRGKLDQLRVDARKKAQERIERRSYWWRRVQ